MSLRTQLLAAAPRLLLVVGSLAATGAAVGAQTAPSAPDRWEIVVPSGRLLPTGAQREALEVGGLTALQAHFAIAPRFAVTATFGWARSRDLATTDEPKLDVFTYDVGAEVRTPQRSAGPVRLAGFAGIGGGARSYNHRSLDVDATHNLAGYASVGGEIGVGRIRLRLEARDYVTGFKPLVGGGDSATRNDVALLAGLRIAGL